MKAIQNLTRLSAVALGTAITSLHADLVIHEPFAQEAGNIHNQPASETGLTGNWVVSGGTVHVATPSTTFFGALAMSDGQLNVLANHSLARVVTSDDLADAGLLDDGATLWFSLVYQKVSGGGTNEHGAFAFGSSHLADVNGTGLSDASGHALGFSWRDAGIRVNNWTGTQVKNAGSTGVSAFSLDGYNTPTLIVGKIEWGVDSADHKLTLYKANPDLTLPTGTTLSVANFDQSGFNTISFHQRSDNRPSFDEIRFGATQADVLPVSTVVPSILSIEDNQGGGPIYEDVAVVTYTLTFDQDMDPATISADDFDNAGDADISIGTISRPIPGVILVQVLPESTGTVQLRIPADRILTSFAGIDLDTSDPILDDTIITIDDGATPNTPGSDRWWDGPTTTGVTDGVSQGGSGTWSTSNPNWDRGVGFESPVAWDNDGDNVAIFGSTAGTVTLAEDITLGGLTINLPTAGGSGYLIGSTGEDNTLTFTGDKLITITATGNNSNQDTIIRAGIAGSPVMTVSGRNNNNANHFQLLPGEDVTHTIGTINMLNTLSSNKRLILGGESDGNVVDTVNWVNTNNQLMLTKAGTGSWTITNDLTFGSAQASRLYVEQGTLTLSGSEYFFSHRIGVATNRATNHTASGLESKLIAKGTFTINDNREHFVIQNNGTLSPGENNGGAAVGSISVGWLRNDGEVASVVFQDGSTYEWQVGATETDVIDLRKDSTAPVSLVIGEMTLKVLDAGGTPSASDQLTVFTYDEDVTTPDTATLNDNITIDISGTSYTGTPSLVNDGNGTIYLTGLIGSAGPSSPYDDWAAANNLTGGDALPTADPDNDGFSNLLEFAFGTDPTVSDAGALTWDGTDFTPGSPVVHVDFPGGGGVDFTARFIRRTDHGDSGSAAYAWQFSSDLSDWEASDDTPAPGWLVAPTVLATDGDYELVEVPYPLFLDSGKKAGFFRVGVTLVP